MIDNNPAVIDAMSDDNVEIIEHNSSSDIPALPPAFLPALPSALPPARPRMQASERFLSWWLPVVDDVIKAIYHPDNVVRKNLIRTILPLTMRFAPVAVSDIPIQTPQLKELHKKYQTRLEIEKQHVRNSTIETLERIAELCAVCVKEDAHSKETIKTLFDAASRLKKRFSDVDSNDIIAKQLLRAVRVVENEKLLRIQVARATAHNARRLSELNTCKLDTEILESEEHNKKTFTPELIDTMRQVYENNIRNIDNQAAELVRMQCKDVWMPGLSVSRAA